MLPSINFPIIDISPEVATVLLFAMLLGTLLLGFPLAWCLGGTALVIGWLTWGDKIWGLYFGKIMGIAGNYVLLAVPLFIFMGIMVERSGISERLFGALYLWLGGLRGGLALSVVLLGTIIAATVGIIGASVVMLGLIGMPALLKRGYSKDLATGSIMAGGTLGILIPPSIMLVVLGPLAEVSVGKLFMAAFPAGFLLSFLYLTYITVRCLIRPKDGPAMPVEERAVPWGRKFFLLFTSLLPPIFLILGVLGSIFFGIAAPTEAAAVGSVFAIILAAAYRALNWRTLFESVKGTLRTTSMILFITIGAMMFQGIFTGLGCGEVVTNLILSVPFGKWGAFLVIMFILFILGMFIDWMGILFVMVPIIAPMTQVLGFDHLWFNMMIVVNLQMSFLTPPFAPAIFYLKGINKPEWETDITHMIKGVIPFILLIVVGMLLMIRFPEILLWLPAQMIR
ncbi:TRAP transporter large permease subunit [Chloroflexota bacterium]